MVIDQVLKGLADLRELAESRLAGTDDPHKRARLADGIRRSDDLFDQVRALVRANFADILISYGDGGLYDGENGHST